MRRLVFTQIRSFRFLKHVPWLGWNCGLWASACNSASPLSQSHLITYSITSHPKLNNKLCLLVSLDQLGVHTLLVPESIPQGHNNRQLKKKDTQLDILSLIGDIKSPIWNIYPIWGLQSSQLWKQNQICGTFSRSCGGFRAKKSLFNAVLGVFKTIFEAKNNNLFSFRE